MLDNGAIGELLRLEGFAPDIFDWGTHWFDMMFFYNDEAPVEWVMGQIEARESRPIFGVTIEGQALSYVKWTNGVFGLMVTGRTNVLSEGTRGEQVGNRLIGSEGTIEVGVREGPQIRLRNTDTGGKWQALEVEGGIHGNEHVVSAILDLVDALNNDREPELSGRRALQATELIFATYESSRRRARIDLPLTIEDSPLASMLETGEISA